MGRLEGKRCLITGGSRGLGRAMAEAFTREGARVAFTFRSNTDDAEEARAALAALGSPPLVFQGSVADAKHVHHVAAELQRSWGGLDVLVNNAGIQQVMPVALLEERDWDEMINVNLKGAFLFSRAALRGMIRQRRGHILCVGAFSSERMIEAPVHYAAAKSGLRGLVEALAREVGRHNVQVNLLGPGLLDVGMGRMLLPHRLKEYAQQSALGRLGTAAEIAEAAVFLDSDEKVVLDGGL
jgi:NAD(P)-dependent dehydrogenase (short-subunit alcohol dehydrogenase family)